MVMNMLVARWIEELQPTQVYQNAWTCSQTQATLGIHKAHGHKSAVTLSCFISLKKIGKYLVLSNSRGH